MKVGSMLALATLAAASLLAQASSAAGQPASPMVRIAELEIDPAQLDTYKRILAEEQEASVRLEPGVIMLHSVELAGQPGQIRLLEVYADRAAYERHIRSPQFLRYKTQTEPMVRSLRLVETRPVLLCAKSRGLSGGKPGCFR